MLRSSFQNPLPASYVQQLPPRQQQATLLFVERVMTLAEVGRRMGITHQAVSRLLQKAARKFQGYTARKSPMLLMPNDQIDGLQERIVARV